MATRYVNLTFLLTRTADVVIEIDDTDPKWANCFDGEGFFSGVAAEPPVLQSLIKVAQGLEQKYWLDDYEALEVTSSTEHQLIKCKLVEECDKDKELEPGESRFTLTEEMIDTMRPIVKPDED